jgi:molybdenum cofactor cytidylyltransferase
MLAAGGRTGAGTRPDGRIDRVIPAVVLAAGKSTRMGRPKALLPIGRDETFLTHIAGTLREAGADDVVVVLGHEADAVAAALGPALPARVVVNRNYERGQLSSLLAGLRAIDRPGVQAMLLALVDVPLVTPATVRAVVERHRATGAPVVRPVQGSRHGHPVLIARPLFAALYAADPEEGAKPIVRAHVSPVGDVEVADEGAFLDVDTPEEYARIVGGRASG